MIPDKMVLQTGVQGSFSATLPQISSEEWGFCNKNAGLSTRCC